MAEFQWKMEQYIAVKTEPEKNSKISSQMHFCLCFVHSNSAVFFLLHFLI